MSLFREVFGLEISQGSMVSWILEARKAAAPAIGKIKEYIMASSVVGFDESGCYTVTNGSTGFKNGLLKCRDYIFNFLRDPAIPPDNNASERGIRNLKITLKNSGCFRSDLGTDAFMDLHSVVETTKKHGNSPYNAILALF